MLQKWHLCFLSLQQNKKQDVYEKNSQSGKGDNKGRNMPFARGQDVGDKGLLLKRNTAALAFGGGCGVVFAAEWADHGIPPL